MAACASLVRAAPSRLASASAGWFVIIASVGALGSAPVALGDLGDLLYQLVAQPDGLAVALVLRQKQGHVEQVTAQVLVEGERREQFPLAWPLAGAAVHPTLPLFAWIEGQPGSAGTLRLVRLTDGSALRPGEPMQLSQ